MLPAERRSRSRELPIMYAVMTWLESDKWPIIFPEVTIPRGLIRGRVDVAAASKAFRQSAAVEVKAVYVQDNPEGQLFDARRAAEYVYFAAPAPVLSRTDIPATVGVLEASTDSIPVRLTVVKPARRGRPDSDTRRAFLHALMRAALQRGRFDSSWTVGKSCPACSRSFCEVWNSAERDEVDLSESIDLE
jgi:hypothetical protein